MVFQNPYASLNPRKTIAAALAEPLVINTALEPRRARASAWRRCCDSVGLRPEHAARYPHMFSGGQRQRVAVARAMMLSPAVVVADEPTSALDVSIQAQILNLFMDLQQSTGTAYVFISHNLSVVQHVAHDVMVMYLGRAVEQGPKAAVLGTPLHPYTQALLAAVPVLNKADRKPRVALVGEMPEPAGAAQRLPLPHPLPAGAGTLQGRGAGAARACRGGRWPAIWCRTESGTRASLDRGRARAGFRRHG